MSKEAMEVAVQEENTSMMATQEAPMGFEDEDSDDMIIPRIKVIQALSPERKEKIADEGDIINSLTKERLNGKKFIPVFKFNNNIWWKDRNDGGGMQCSSRDGKQGQSSDGTCLLCAFCKKNEFDNTKQGRDAAPKCTKYINYFGFFEGERMPIILSFARTNYNEGKKLYSLAKVTMQNMWNYSYVLQEKLMSKGGNDWYILTTTPGVQTTEEDREFALSLYKSFRNNSMFEYDLDEAAAATPESNVNVDKTEY